MSDKPKPQDGPDIPVASLPQSYWEMEHRRILLYSNWLCEKFGHSRPGYVKGQAVPVKELRKMIFNNDTSEGKQ